MRNALWLSLVSIFTLLLVQTLFSQPVGLLRYVNNTDSTCQGNTPCYSTLQAAVDAVQAGDTIRVQPGHYNEAVVVKGKNKAATTEADRIIIEADPAAPNGSVVVGTADTSCTTATVFQFASSRFVTLRGVTIRNAGVEAIRLLGANHHNTDIHIDRNRILGNGVCPGGIVIAKGNSRTVLANNVIDGNGANGVTFAPGQGGPHYVVGNTIHGNGQNGVSLDWAQEVWLVNNVITRNGANPPAAASNGFGVKRTPSGQPRHPQLAVLLANLICGNESGELSGALLDSTDQGNLTPTGQEGKGVSRSPGCDNMTNIYAALNGADGLSNTPDDDFTLATASPAIDHGIDPRTLGLGPNIDPLFTADFTAEAVRPRDGNGGGVAAFDMGALEKSASGGGGSGCTPGATQSCYTGPADTAGVGVCQVGTQTCGADRTFGACVGEVLPGIEIPNNSVDENCDGHDAECAPGAVVSCYSGPEGTASVGICKAGTQTCSADGLFGSCAGEILPTTEIPDNGIDEDCNGADKTTGPPLPPDPKTVAPPVEPGVATTIDRSTAFLYTGANPIQTGVAPNTIEPKRAAVIRGTVLDKTNAPLPGVTITILNHPEFGQTLSRADGMFDMAVNGGGLLTVSYRKSGLLSAQRQVNAPWQDYVMAPDAMLIQLDNRVTAIDLTNTTTVQVARGNPVTDVDGTRQATILFPAGAQATMTLPDGSIQAMTTLHVRATEFTVGSNGPQSMPANLPPSSGYTYEVEYSVDEAEAAGAMRVSFSQPIISYTENFVGFPVGTLVPYGEYDRKKGMWIACENGRVIKILSIAQGLATLDLDGSGQAASASALVALGISAEELQNLAVLYPSGQSLWRVPIDHILAIN